MARKKRVKTTQTKINSRKQNRTRKQENPKKKKKRHCWKKGRPSQYPRHEHQERLTKQGLKRKKNSAHAQRSSEGGGILRSIITRATTSDRTASSTGVWWRKRRRVCRSNQQQTPLVIVIVICRSSSSSSSSVVVIDTLSGRSEFLFTIFLFAGCSFFCWESRGSPPPFFSTRPAEGLGSAGPAAAAAAAGPAASDPRRRTGAPPMLSLPRQDTISTPFSLLAFLFPSTSLTYLAGARHTQPAGRARIRARTAGGTCWAACRTGADTRPPRRLGMPCPRKVCEGGGGEEESQ